MLRGAARPPSTSGTTDHALRAVHDDDLTQPAPRGRFAAAADARSAEGLAAALHARVAAAAEELVRGVEDDMERAALRRRERAEGEAQDVLSGARAEAERVRARAALLDRRAGELEAELDAVRRQRDGLEAEQVALRGRVASEVEAALVPVVALAAGRVEEARRSAQQRLREAEAQVRRELVAGAGRAGARRIGPRSGAGS